MKDQLATNGFLVGAAPFFLFFANFSVKSIAVVYCGGLFREGTGRRAALSIGDKNARETHFGFEEMLRAANAFLRDVDFEEHGVELK